MRRSFDTPRHSGKIETSDNSDWESYDSKSYEEQLRDYNRIMAEFNRQRSSVERHSEVDMPRRNMDEPKDSEGIADYANNPQSSREENLNNARDAVLEAYGKKDKGGAHELEYKKPENSAAYNERLSSIDSKVKDMLFSSFTDIRRMIGDEQYDNLVDTINEDIYGGKYENAKYEDGQIQGVGAVNEYGEKTIAAAEKENMLSAEYLKPENEEKYSEQAEAIDPKVYDKIGQVVYILGVTLGDKSIEYAKARHKIMSDIYDGRYKNAKYEVTSDDSDEFERGVIVFN